MSTTAFKFDASKDVDESGSTNNGERAERANRTRKAYGRDCRYNAADLKEDYAITDIVSDLGHLADREGKDFEQLIDQALRCWRDER